MGKTSHIIKREYSTRVRKRSFIIMSVIGPLLFAIVIVAPVWLSKWEQKETRVIAVIDSSKIFSDTRSLEETKYLKFEYLENKTVQDLKKEFDTSHYYAVLFIGHVVVNTPDAVQLISDKEVPPGIQMHIAKSMEKQLDKEILRYYDVPEKYIEDINLPVKIQTLKWVKGEKKESNAELKRVIGYIFGFLIYFFIFLFGAQVMRGVMEEKTNRIVELILTSVKPLQLMIGKIVGIAMVGLTQFLLWIIFTFLIVITLQSVFFSGNELQELLNSGDETVTSTYRQFEPIRDDTLTEIQDMFTAVEKVDFIVMLVSFIFYFIGGYLLYASLFAAIGSAVDDIDTDTRQFMLPITVPLILSIIVLFSAVSNPDGPLAFWFSIIPFTSPVIMMARIPFGVPWEEVALSYSLLVLTFLGISWLAGRIYRTGIILYGKKVTYKDLWKWIKKR